MWLLGSVSDAVMKTEGSRRTVAWLSGCVQAASAFPGGGVSPSPLDLMVVWGCWLVSFLM